MKRIGLLSLFTALCLTMMAQGKLTPQAQLHLMQQAKIGRLGDSSFSRLGDSSFSRLGDSSFSRLGKVTTPNNQKVTTLVLTLHSGDITGTVAQMKALGAEVCSRLGRQVVVRVPMNNVEALQGIEGIQRIDRGHRGRWKSDVTRKVTGVNLLNGPTVTEGTTAYTGKGVTICLIDAGFDFQHPAFKDAEGRSRIKCVYLMGDENGHKFTVNDPELGDITFPGSVYDTPELIATLTTDDDAETHGTHTAGIAAGSISPMGFGGMAPEADLVLVPLDEVEVEGLDITDEEEYMELALAFVNAYAAQSEQPVVLSCSANSHSGPHDGTSSITEAIEQISEHAIPIFSAGNEGGYPIHLYQQFTASKKSVKTIMLGLGEDEIGEHLYECMTDVAGYVRTGDEVSLQLTLVSLNQFTGKVNTLWTSETVTATPGCNGEAILTYSENDETLGKYFDGVVGLAAMENENGRLCVTALAEGGIDKLYLWILTVSGSEGTEIDLWDEMAGFGGRNIVGLPGYVDGDNDISGGDWTCTERVVSVGAYCANVMERSLDGDVQDTSVAEDEDDDVDTLDDIAWFSSYGTSFNGITQPVVCAPGVNVVSSVNSYAFPGMTYADDMQWDGYPYTAFSGTSMSCPAVAGIVALWLQAKPDMTLTDVMDVLAQSSVNDDFTAKSPIRWGYGRISATRGIDFINRSSGIETIYGAYNQSRTDAYYDLQGRRFHAVPTASGIYIHQGRKVVIK